MKTTTQSGFAIGIVVAILAVLALAGGGAYVATKNRAEVEMNSTTTDMYGNATGTMENGVNIDVTGGANIKTNGGVNADVNMGATTSLDAGVNATTSVGGAGVNLNLGGSGSAGY